MQLYMKEVNFGEAICLQQNDHKLFVDCGAKSGAPGITAAATAANAVQGLLLNHNKEALVTHFDEDHYNGFTELAQRLPAGVYFDNLYLPLFIYRNRKLGWTANALTDTVKVWAYQMVTGKSRKLSKLHQFFLSIPRLVPNRNNVHCVYAGQTISLDEITLEVLWPDPGVEKLSTSYSDFIEEILNKNLSDKNAARIINAVNRYARSFQNVLRMYIDENNDLIEQVVWVDLAEAYDALTTLDIGQTIQPDILKIIYSYSSSVIKSMNECSVVLRHENELLMLGDVSPKIFNNYIYPQLLDDTGALPEFKAVKVSHHGTTSYYTNQLPQAKIYLVSNSGTSYPNWTIDENYGLHHADAMQCTNTVADRCEYYKIHHFGCPMCNVGRPTGDIDINIDAL